MIARTLSQIDRLRAHHERELKDRYARRTRIRYIDRLLDKFELLNLAEAPDAPHTLKGEVIQLASEDEHPVVRRFLRDIPLAEWMDTLYDLQHPLLFTVEDDVD